MTAPRNIERYDVFISHASEDKDFVRPLAHELVAAGLRVWYDEFELNVGDSLNAKINNGLSRSRYGLVVVSRSFFTKDWPQHEMNGLIARQTSGERVILPVWHRITKNEIIDYAPPLADIVSFNSSNQTMEEIVAGVIDQVGKRDSHVIESTITTPEKSNTGPSFAVFYIAPAHASPLREGEVPEPSFFQPSFAPTGWISLVDGDEELEYVLEETTLRVGLDWGNQWQGDEIHAYQLVTGNEPFALIIRPAKEDQIYLPSVIKSSPSRSWMGPQSRSGWMVFEIQE